MGDVIVDHSRNLKNFTQHHLWWLWEILIRAAGAASLQATDADLGIVDADKSTLETMRAMVVMITHCLKQTFR